MKSERDLFYIGVVSDTCRDGRGLLLADDDIGNILLFLLADSLPLCTLCESEGKVNQGKASCRFKSCPFCSRWSTAFSWRESKTWGSRRPTWRSWPDTWPSSTRSVCFSSGQRSEWWRQPCAWCVLKETCSFFLPNLNCRTACWPVAPGSWRAMERVRCRAPGPPPALSSHLQNSTTALSRTRSAYTVATISGENTAKPSKDCCVPAVFMDTIINVSHFCSSVRQWRRCLPDSWCRSVVYPGTRLLLYWSATAPHTGDRLLLFAWWKWPAFTVTLTTNFIVSFWPTRS